MGSRLGRIPVGEAKFSFIPANKEMASKRHLEETNSERRDIDAIYYEAHRQVYGNLPKDSVGRFTDKVFRLATEAGLPVPLFILISMFGYTKTFPEKTFSARVLVDGRSLYRVQVYAEECRRRYMAVSAKLIDVFADSNLAGNDFKRLMLASEIKAGRWIIEYKLWNQGLPYDPMFDAIENELHPAWLATEPRYLAKLVAYSTRTGSQPEDRQPTRHKALDAFQRMKRYQHEAIANFRVREGIMAEAVAEVLNTYGYRGDDFEIEDKPLCDPLLFWNRLGAAMQHLECLLFVNYSEGIYANK